VNVALSRQRSSVITALQAKGVTPAVVEHLLEQHGVPIVEGPTCTFVWRGDADLVAVEHRVAGLPAPLPMRRLRSSDLWYVTTQFPRGARVEYRLMVRHGDRVENMLDPLNPRVARGPTSEMSVLLTDGYVTPDWTQHDPEAPPGIVTELILASRALRRNALVLVYAPARVVRGHRYPLLVMHDGKEFLEYSALGTVLDNLMHRRLIADCFVACTHPHDRMREYTASAAHTRFVNTELVPELESTLPLGGEPGSRVLGGASLGAVASLATASRRPGMYGGLLLMSGSFRSSLPGGMPALTSVVRLVSSLQARPRWVAPRIFQTYGAFEPLAEPNRAMTPALRRMTDELHVVEGLDGHNWTNWRDRLLEGLSWLLPPGAAVHTGTPEARAS